VWLVPRRVLIKGRIGGDLFFLFSNPPESAAFVSSTTMAPQLDVAQHIIIETLLKEGFETKLIASEASCNIRAIRESV
jgi:hypothetical protein